MNPEIAAKRLGLSLGEYERHVAAGEKWCPGCREWHPVQMFGPDRDRTQRYCRNWRAESFRRWLLARVLVK